MRIVRPSATLLHATPDPDQVIERAGRTAYQSWNLATGPGASATFVKMLIDRDHESVLEHASAGFVIVTDRGVTHELVRHRIASYTQESTRYCNYARERFGNELTFIRPPGPSDSDPRHAVWEKAMEVVEGSYLALVDMGAPPEYARAVLPNSIKSEIVMSANFREWRHFLRLRTSTKAHPQMREVAELIRAILLKLSPACFGDVP